MERIMEFLTDGDGNGYGGGFGSGCGDAFWSGDAFWNGDGSGDGSGYGSGRNYGYGYGDGDGDGDGISIFDGSPVWMVDGVQTIITVVKSGFAKGYVLNSDLTMTPCYIAKGGGKFAHGATLNKAVAALQAKLFQDMPEEARISAFIKAHPDKNAKVPARDLWDWHNRLTGSCEMGRNQFAADRGIDIDRDEFTPLEFCEMCKGSYGGDVIRRLEEAYGV